jgi:hypothetical protein
LGFSYGFRPKRNQHQTLDALAFGSGKQRMNWVLDWYFFQPGIPCVWQVRGADRPADDDDDQQRRFNVAIAVFLLNPRKKSDELTIAWRENRVAATLFVRRDAAPTAEKKNGPGKDIVGKLDAQIGIRKQNRQHADAALQKRPGEPGRLKGQTSRDQNPFGLISV